jgi:hypothetical protein
MLTGKVNLWIHGTIQHTASVCVSKLQFSITYRIYPALLVEANFDTVHLSERAVEGAHFFDSHMAQH